MAREREFHLNVESQEWLVTNQRGAFAMGTLQGQRTRKYHGFLMGIPGRAESAFLSELEFQCNDHFLWPPTLSDSTLSPRSQVTPSGPRWTWALEPEEIVFGVEKSPQGLLTLFWELKGGSQKNYLLKVRGFWAMRDLHSTGGNLWQWNLTQNVASRNDAPSMAMISSGSKKAYCLLRGPWKWRDDPRWHKDFYYSEEEKRGYPAFEDLYSAGTLEVMLQAGDRYEWVLGESLEDFIEDQGTDLIDGRSPRLFDFVLTHPPGIVAGFPWFGEWGRDTFISLPGIVGSTLSSEDHLHEPQLALNPCESWALDLMHRWGRWIEQEGMIPNLIEKNNRCQWESADATLWWCHSLTSLWAYSLGSPSYASQIRREFEGLLSMALNSIKEGRHYGLKPTPHGTLEVTEPRATWMDAQVKGKPVTPRLGELPEINALWFQACTLQGLWRTENCNSPDSGIESEWIQLGTEVLKCREPSRPNSVFLHSLPLAPSFVLKDSEALRQDVESLAWSFWTPFGLRTLIPTDPHYRPRYEGPQFERDQSYHQGPAWGWLAGHFEMAKSRNRPNLKALEPERSIMMNEMPIPGHIPELFEAEAPFLPRGAPAQAWSLACSEEAKTHQRLRLDSKLSHILSQRWLGREERKKKEPTCTPPDKSEY